MIEVITLNKKDSLAAQKLGANRLELVRNLEKGGLTPDISIIKKVTKAVSIPTFVMLRNRYDTFVYSENDLDLILKQLNEIKQTKATGIVFGSLLANGKINTDHLKKIIANKGHLELTFHRAIDQTENYFEAIKLLNEYNVDYILTSGHFASAIEGKTNIEHAIELSKHHILAGAGISPLNVSAFANLNCSVHIGTSIRKQKDISKPFSQEAWKNLREFYDSN